MLYVCIRDVMDVVFSVCIVKRGARGAHVWEVSVFRHAEVVCMCLVCILWPFSMLSRHMKEAFSRAGLMTTL